jgi:glycosyltransferase involved in cell wall biosynthesis
MKVIEKVPFFSIILPVYNNEHNLEKCIYSILRQSCKDFELILVDDGSTDGSIQICDEFACKDKRIKVIHQENKGTARARYKGLLCARGKYIYFVDGDDWVAKNLLKRALKELNIENPPDIFAFCYLEVRAKGKCVKKNFGIQEGLYNKERLERVVYPKLICRLGKFTYQSGVDMGSLCNKIIEKKLILEHYCRDFSLFCAEDSVCSWECMYFANRIYFSEEALYYYNRLSDTSIRKKYHADLFENYKTAASYVRKFLVEKEEDLFEHQINAKEICWIMEAVNQEIMFDHAIYESNVFLKNKTRVAGDFPVCISEELPFFLRIYAILLNAHYFWLIMLGRKCKKNFWLICSQYKRRVLHMFKCENKFM